MKREYRIVALTTLLAGALLGGCGGGTGGETTAISKLESSSACIGCHGTVVSPGTGVVIADEWKLSGHNTKNGASCADCHEPKAGHPNSCNSCHNGPNAPLQDEVVRNPDTALKCDKCHGRGQTHELPRNHYYGASYDALPSSKITWDNMSTVAWVTSKTVGNCTACHNPHNSVITQQHKDWAESGHGDINGEAWRKYDFKFRRSGTNATGVTGVSPRDTTSSDCVRCHTTTGYINYVTSSFRNISTWGSNADRGKQTLYCNACHIDGSGRSYGYKLRPVPQVTAFYNYSVAKVAVGSELKVPARRLTANVYPQLAQTYPHLGDSNICMVCHVGREAGVTLATIDRYLNDKMTAGVVTFRNYTSFYNNLGFVNSHYLTAGATVFKISGFEFPGQNYANDIHYMHDQIGRNNTSGTGTSGPCVTCHMKPGRHTFKQFTFDGNGNRTALTSPICAKCHNSGAPEGDMTAERANQLKASMDAALAALNAMLQKNGIYFAETNPYFFKSSNSTASSNAFKKWRKLETMGAAFNFNLIYHDPGAFAHNSLYVKRLIHDSIDWLSTSSSQTFGNNGTFGAPGNVQSALDTLVTQGKLTGSQRDLAAAYLLKNGARP